MGYTEPFDTWFEHRLELTNEVNLMFIMYTIICFSPLVNDYKIKSSIGILCIAFIALNLSINLYFMLKESIRNIILKFKLWLKKRENNKQREIRMEKRSQILTVRRAIRDSNIERRSDEV